MAFGPGLAQLLRDDLADLTVAEQKMFGGLAFMLGGHMVCGLHRGGGMFRVGKAGMDRALAVPGVQVMAMAGRAMPGMAECPPEVLADDTRRHALLAVALGTVQALPPKVARKVAKPGKG